MSNAGPPPAPRRRVPALVAALLSLVVPGSGQALLGEWGRGLAFLASLLILAALVVSQEV